MICYCQNSFRRIFGLIVYFLQEKKTKTKKQKWIEREIRVYEKNGCVFSSYCFKIKIIIRMDKSDFIANFSIKSHGKYVLLFF